MQVLGELISLNQGDRLALPWWHRACLGFISNTSVYVAAVWNNAKRPPDLIVTVFDPRQWAHLYRVMIQQEDRPGVLAKHFQSVSPHNIAVAESAVISNGAVYHDNMYIEDRKSLKDREFVRDLNFSFGDRSFFEFSERPMAGRTLKRGFSGGIITTFLSELGTAPVKHRYLDYVQVQGGWLKVKWKQQLLTFMDEEKISYDGFDLTKAVLSADTSSRILRFVFPRHDAKSIVVPHADSPGEAGAICKLITEDGSNLLSATIRRIRAGRQAELVAVCEPPRRRNSDLDYAAELMDRLGVDFPGVSIRTGRRAKDTITPLQKFDRIITIPHKYQKSVDVFWGQSAGKKIIFVSRRDALEFHEEILTVIRSALHEYGFGIVESNAQYTNERFTPDDVHSKLWAAIAAIVLIGPVVSSELRQRNGRGLKSPEGTLWINVAHEIGHLQGQEKPLLFLVDKREKRPFDRMPNLQGAHYHQYSTLPRKLGAKGAKEIKINIKKWIQDNFSEEIPIK